MRFRVPRFIQRLAEISRRVIPILLIASLFASFIPPPPSFASSQLSGPYGSVNLQLTSFNVYNYTRLTGYGRAIIIMDYYGANGTVFIGGSWYYINQTYVNSTTTTTAYKAGGGSGGASATNTSAYASASATATASANTTTTIKASVQSEVPAPIRLYGYAKFYFVPNYNVTVSLKFNNNTYYTGESANFTTSKSVQASINEPLLYVIVYIVPVNPINNQTIGAPLVYTYAPVASVFNLIDLYNTIVALPQFNDTMLFAYATKPSNDQPALPLEPYYNLMAIIGIIVLIPIAFIDLIPSAENKERVGWLQVLMKISFGILVILIFPFVYDKIAYLLNIVNQMIIAYPLPYYDYTVALANLEHYLVFPSTVTLLTALSTVIFVLAYFIIAVIIWILSYMLGTIRILLIAGMIIMFPLSVALRDFRYTSKLGRMIEETLFGLILATILSASMLGIANFLITNWNSPANMFRLAGIQSQWVAISAVVGALFAPTVLAPLVSTVYESTAMMASVTGGVATAEALGGIGGMLQGAHLADVKHAGGLQGLRLIGRGLLVGLGQSAVSSLPLIGSLGGGQPMSIKMHHGIIMQSLGRLLTGAGAGAGAVAGAVKAQGQTQQTQQAQTTSQSVQGLPSANIITPAPVLGLPAPKVIPASQQGAQQSSAQSSAQGQGAQQVQQTKQSPLQGRAPGLGTTSALGAHMLAELGTQQQAKKPTTQSSSSTEQSEQNNNQGQS